MKKIDELIINNKKKRIYFFLPNIIDDGIKKTLDIYSKHFSREFKVYVVTNSRFNLLKKKNIKIINPKNKFFFKNRFLNTLFCIYQLVKNINNHSVVFSLDDHSILLILKKFFFKFKLILRTSNPIYNPSNKMEINYENYEGFTNKKELFLYKYADLVITFFEKNKRNLKNLFNVKNVEVVYNFFEKKKIKRYQKKTYNIFFIGRFVESKDPIFFLKNAIEVLKKKNINIVLIGKGYLLNKIKSITQKKKKNIKIINFVKKPFKKFAKKIDILCVTSKFDGTPNVLGEAIGVNIPCIAPRNIGLSNLLLNNGKWGELYHPKNNKDFQKKLLLVLNNYSKALKKSDLAFRGLDRFDKNNTLVKLQKLINKIF